MALLAQPLVRFALIVVAGIAAVLLVVWLTGFDGPTHWIEAVIVGLATMLVGTRSWHEALGALLIAVAAHMAIMVMPIFFLIGYTFNPIANRQLAEAALTIAGIFAVPILAGTLIYAYRHRNGARP
ncbi:MAG: hypothetical protein N4A39_11360 [Roseicyclus sp.]|jgi:hypothetical protein|nr:hypothetical protein [Roseicyclus sp.]